MKRNDYSDIINRPHHVSKTRPRMPRLNRAAQFSPFAALTGYEDLISEAARHTEEKRVLDEDRKAELDRLLNLLLYREEEVEAEFTFFCPDRRKSGGEYITERGFVLRYDEFAQSVTLSTGRTVPVNDIFSINCDLLP